MGGVLLYLAEEYCKHQLLRYLDVIAEFGCNSGASCGD